MSCCKHNIKSRAKEKFTRVAMDTAVLWAGLSKDRSTKVGACIIREDRIVSTGYNGFHRGSQDLDEHIDNRNEKYQRTIHAEMNAILNAARDGVSIEGTSLVVTHTPCRNCAIHIANSGITEVIYGVDSSDDPEFNQRFQADESLLVFEEAGIKVSTIDRVNKPTE